MQVTAVLLILTVVVGIVVALFGRLDPTSEQQAADATGAPTPASTVRIEDSPYAQFIENSTGSQISFFSLTDGFRTGTSTERFARPALSLGKLYIAQYVMENGTEEEQETATEMIRNSSDVAAEVLYEAYPESIDEIADEYGLLSTRGEERWGYSMTSTYDLVRFVALLIEDDPESPILEAMRNASDVAEDGYPQDWGTAVLDGVEGSKWGWSDDRMLHTSVSFGEGYVVAAATTGTRDDLTQLVENQLSEVVKEHS
ncbi:hypothetical protein CDES_04205 [Corynebacterium deserti GIMN1.010]|uniref:Uncharacterized protein n=1 Tax=Corynebacterium deserti GIMN1.010 TaxID=931089 RepID=A0A0M4CW34_9CORY|nr:hypothetical protein CDES_04205 [Corynebacterium deserti GIMN1.010]